MGIDEIDPTTLAIHFPNMVDKKGNKIFASLNKDGKGGDIVYDEISKDKEVFLFNKLTNSIVVVNIEDIANKEMYMGLYDYQYSYLEKIEIKD